MNLKVFLLKEIYNSAEVQNIKVDEDVVHYLTQIMEAISINKDLLSKNITLAELYMKAQQISSDSLKLKTYKKIGDISIAKIGLFPESINKVMNKKYYYNMGSLAYDFCYNKTQDNVFYSLSKNIEDYSDIIYGVKNCSITNNIIELYEDWQKTKSNFSKRRLLTLGFSLHQKIISE